MNFKQILTAAASLLFSAGLTVSVSAQRGAVPAARTQNPQGEMKGEPRGRRPDLNLTDEQKAQLKSMRQSQRDQMMALRNDKNLTQEQRIAKLRALREGTRQQLQGILTPQQQERIKSARAERQGQRMERGPGRGAERAMNFTADQRAQLKSIHQSTREQVNAVRNDSTLTQEQRIAKLQAIHQNTRQQMSGILTTEQQQKMKEVRRGARRGGPGRPGGQGGRRGGRLGGSLRVPAGAPSTQTPAKP